MTKTKAKSIKIWHKTKVKCARLSINPGFLGRRQEASHLCKAGAEHSNKPKIVCYNNQKLIIFV